MEAGEKEGEKKETLPNPTSGNRGRFITSPPHTDKEPNATDDMGGRHSSVVPHSD